MLFLHLFDTPMVAALRHSVGACVQARCCGDEICQPTYLLTAFTGSFGGMLKRWNRFCLFMALFRIWILSLEEPALLWKSRCIVGIECVRM